MLAEGKYASLSLIDDAMPIVVQTVWTPQFAAWGKGRRRPVHVRGREHADEDSLLHLCLRPVLRHRWMTTAKLALLCKECGTRMGRLCSPSCGAAYHEACYRGLMSLMMAVEEGLRRDQVPMKKIQERKRKRVEEEEEEEEEQQLFSCKTRYALEAAPLDAAREWEVHHFGVPLTPLP